MSCKERLSNCLVFYWSSLSFTSLRLEIPSWEGKTALMVEKIIFREYIITNDELSFVSCDRIENGSISQGSFLWDKVRFCWIWLGLIQSYHLFILTYVIIGVTGQGRWFLCLHCAGLGAILRIFERTMRG